MLPEPSHSTEESSSVTAGKEQNSSSRKKTVTVPRLWGTILFSSLAFVGVVTGLSGVGVAWILLLAIVSFSFAAASPHFSAETSRRGDQSLVGSVPAGFLILAGWIVSAGLLAGLLNVHIWGNRLSSIIFTGVTLFLPIVASFIRKGNVAITYKGEISPGVSFLLCWSVGVYVGVTQSFPVWSRAVSASTDYARHLIFMKELLGDGNLTYGTSYYDQTYPRGPHTLIGVLWQAAGGGTYASGWRAGESVMWLMVCLIFFSLILVSVKIAYTVKLPSFVVNIIIPAALLFILFQGCWITTFNQGFVNSVFAGAVISCLFAYGVTSRWRGTLTSVVLSLACVILIANSWILLNTIVGCVFITAIIFWVRKKPSKTEWFIAAGATILTVVCSLPVVLSTLNVSQDAESMGTTDNKGIFSAFSIFGYSGLPTPSLWWVVNIIVCAVTLAVMFRVLPDARTKTVWASVVIFSGIVFSVFLIVVSHSSWNDIKYYPLKTLWTVLPLTLAVTIPSILWCIGFAYVFVMRQKSAVKLAGIAVLGFVLVGSLAGVGGWLKGYGKPDVVDTVLSGQPSANTNIVLPLMEGLETKNVTPSPRGQKVIVYGLVPYSNPLAIVSRTTNLYDVIGEKTVTWLGYSTDSTVGPKIVADKKKDPVKMCDVLKENPDALYVTGPNPQAGPQRLLDAGCPEQTVQPDKWVVVPIGDEWYQNTGLYKKPYMYPSWEQTKEFQKKVDAGALTPQSGKK